MGTASTDFVSDAMGDSVEVPGIPGIFTRNPGFFLSRLGVKVPQPVTQVRLGTSEAGIFYRRLNTSLTTHLILLIRSVMYFF